MATSTQALEKVEAPEKLSAYLERIKPQLSDVLPRHMTPEWIIGVTCVAVSKTPKLATCSFSSIAQSVMIAAQLGLDPSGIGQMGHLVPFWNSDKRTNEAQFIPGYRGLIDLARRSGDVTKVVARAVFANERFHVWYGTRDEIEHEPEFDAEKRGAIRCTYAVAFMKAGSPQFDVLPMAEIERLANEARARAKGRKSTWDTHFDEMAKKSAVRRLAKMLPQSNEFARALELQRLAEYEERADYEAIGFRTAQGLEPRVASKPATTRGEQLMEKLREKNPQAAAVMDAHLPLTPMEPEAIDAEDLELNAALEAVEEAVARDDEREPAETISAQDAADLKDLIDEAKAAGVKTKPLFEAYGVKKLTDLFPAQARDFANALSDAMKAKS